MCVGLIWEDEFFVFLIPLSEKLTTVLHTIKDVVCLWAVFQCEARTAGF